MTKHRAVNAAAAAGAVGKVSSADFRFVSAWVQGIEVQAAWERYQAHRGTGDLRRIRTTVRGILDHLTALANRHGDAYAAAVLRRDPTRIKALEASSAPTKAFGATAMPTLSQFAAELENADVYSEAELVELLEERYGKVASIRPDAVRKAGRTQRDTPELLAIKRKGRLVARQVEALRRLESPGGFRSCACRQHDRLARSVDLSAAALRGRSVAG